MLKRRRRRRKRRRRRRKEEEEEKKEEMTIKNKNGKSLKYDQRERERET